MIGSNSGYGLMSTSQSNVGNVPRNGDCPRFPRLQDCAHFHYEYTEIGPLEFDLVAEEDETEISTRSSGSNGSNNVVNFVDSNHVFRVRVSSSGKTWIIRRNFEDFRKLDRQCHQCVYDRRHSQLQEIPEEEHLKASSNGISLKVRRAFFISSHFPLSSSWYPFPNFRREKLF